MSARVRILAAILVVVAAGMAIAGGVTFAMQRERALADLDVRLHEATAPLRALDSGKVPAPTTEGVDTAAFKPTEYSSTRDYVDTLIALLPPGRAEATLGIVDGKAVAHLDRGVGDLSTDDRFVADVVAATTSARGEAIQTTSSVVGEVRYIAIPVTVETDAATGIYVRVADVGAELDPVVASATTYAVTTLIMLAVIAVVGWFVVGRVLLSPIRSLRQTAEAVTLSDLHQRVPAAANDDIGDVGRTVNEMLDRLEGSVDVQRRLLDDVRHELKTPITIVRGHLEMMNVEDRDDVASARDIGISELDRMTRLVEDIDLLAAVEDDEYTMGLVDIGTLTTRVGELVVGIPGHAWKMLDRASVVVRGNPDRLLQAWLALADNAAKYTPDGSSIELGSTIVGGSVHLWLRDHGPGIPPSARRRIFRRFDRGFGRRDVGGSGLGLAIVDAITRAHGGSCTVTDTPGGGATFVIRIPVKLGGNASVFPAPVRAGDAIQQWEETG